MMLLSACKIPAVEYSEPPGASAREDRRDILPYIFPSEKIRRATTHDRSLSLGHDIGPLSVPAEYLNQEGASSKLDQTRLFLLTNFLGHQEWDSVTTTALGYTVRGCLVLEGSPPNPYSPRILLREYPIQAILLEVIAIWP